MSYKVAVIRGEGIGPEVIQATVRILEAMALPLEFINCPAGYSAWKKLGDPIPQDSWSILGEASVIFKGPAKTPVGPQTFKSVTVSLRQAFDLYANVRPMKTRHGVDSLQKDVDLIIMRENTEGLYVRMEERLEDSARAVRLITRRASERIARFAFEYATASKRRRVTVCHKATVLPVTCGLFRESCLDVARNYSSVRCDEMMIDTAAYNIVTAPQSLDILLTTNLFGDILSDVAAGVVGGLGLTPSANVGEVKAMFEPVHGTAEQIAGRNIANPTAAILSAAMMLKHLGLWDEAANLESALNVVLAEGRAVTPDLKGNASTTQMVDEIISVLTRRPRRQEP
ncbi:MAG: isocitrate/isopropylmalate dehydrogenase family protein [Candidatus Bathyarchaeia archaeon]